MKMAKPYAIFIYQHIKMKLISQLYLCRERIRQFTVKGGCQPKILQFTNLTIRG